MSRAVARGGYDPLYQFMKRVVIHEDFHQFLFGGETVIDLVVVVFALLLALLAILAHLLGSFFALPDDTM